MVRTVNANQGALRKAREKRLELDAGCDARDRRLDWPCRPLPRCVSFWVSTPPMTSIADRLWSTRSHVAVLALLSSWRPADLS